MSGTRLSDAELGRLLRAHVPAEAPELRHAIQAHVASTRQQRSVPGLICALMDADPMARRRALLLAAILLLAVGAAAAAVVGAIIDRRPPDSVVDLAIEPPADLRGFVLSAYSAMPRLPSMTITVLEDGARVGRIFVDGAGPIRVEHFASPDATSPATYEIFSGTSRGELLVVDSRSAWYEQEGAISEDPRVFVYAQLGSATWGGGAEPGCEVAISPGEVYSYAPGNAWRYVGLETVAGRPAHQVTCEGRGDLWIDVETRLTLRSQGVRRDEGGWPIAGTVHTVEVGAIAPGLPPASLFEIRRPEGVRALSAEEYEHAQCVRSGYCGAPSRPVVMPPAAPGEQPLTVAAELVRLAEAARAGLAPYAVTFQEMSSGTPAGQDIRTRQLFDGTSRYRIERTSQLGTIWEATSVELAGDGYRYVGETQVDGTMTWNSSQRGGPTGYPLGITATCRGGWENRGVDLILGRVADHVGCVDEHAGDFWIDRATHLVLRTQVTDDSSAGTRVQEVVELRLGLVQGVEWDIPPSAFVRP